MRSIALSLALVASFFLGSEAAIAQATTPVPTCARAGARYYVYRFAPFNEGNNQHFVPLITYAVRHHLDRSRPRWWEDVLRDALTATLIRLQREEAFRRDPVSDNDTPDATIHVRLTDYPRYVLERADVPWREICGAANRAPDMHRIPPRRTFLPIEVRVLRRTDPVPTPWVRLLDGGTHDEPSPVPERETITFPWATQEDPDLLLDL